MDITLDQIEALIERANTPTFLDVGAKPILVIPSSHKIDDVERFLPNPVAKRGTLRFTRLESFASYVGVHENESTRLFFNGTDFKVVFDHHSKELPGWKHHVATFTPTHSPQWLTWFAKNRVPLKQADFAEFIEENRSDVITPDAATLLDMVRELESVKDATFKSALKNDNTVQRVYYEDNTVTRTKGDIELPTEITLSINVYAGAPRTTFHCRFKVTLNNGVLFLNYEIRNLNTRLEEIKEALVKQVEDATELAPLFGDE